MSLLNKEELRRQIKSGEFTSLDGVLDEFKDIIREVIQTSTTAELDEHLGYGKNASAIGSNYRNGHNTKTLKTTYGNIDVAIPRDREGSFEPKLVKKREVILEGSEDLIISLYAKGMTVRDIQSHLDDLYGYELSTTTISNITEAILTKAKEWQHRPLEVIYPIVFMDATVLKIKVDGVVKNIAAYIMLGITLEGKKEIIGIWLGGNESAKYWLTLLNDIKNRGVKDILIFAIDGLTGFNEAITTVYPEAEIQRCIVHQIRTSLRYVSYKDKKELAGDLKPIYTANNEELAKTSLKVFKDKWDDKYPNIATSWHNNWNELSTFFKYPEAIRKLIYTTNPIESLNARIKQKTKHRGAFPTYDAAFKVLYLACYGAQEKWHRTRVRDWAEIYPQLCIYFDDVMAKYDR